MRFLFIALFGAIFLFATAHAWGFEGHRVTARIAEHFMSPTTKAAVYKLVGGKLWQKSNTYPDGPICYPDRYDHNEDAHGNENSTYGIWSYPLHFAYSNTYAFFDYECDCKSPCYGAPEKMQYCTPDETLLNCCVVAGIQKMDDELFMQFGLGKQDPNQGQPTDPGPDLKVILLGHFLGDAHQPMHVDLNNDQGGNDYNVTYMGKPLCSGHLCNLHGVWDAMMIRTRLLDWGPDPYPSKGDDYREGNFSDHIVQHLTLLFNLSEGYPEARTDPELWASDTVMLASMAYLVEEGFDVGQHYYQNALPIIEIQLFRAGLRMASALNYIFGGHQTSCGSRPCRWWPNMCQRTPDYRTPGRCSDHSARKAEKALGYRVPKALKWI